MVFFKTEDGKKIGTSEALEEGIQISEDEYKVLKENIEKTAVHIITKDEEKA